MTYKGYKVVYRVNLNELEHEVLEQMRRGWQCQGGVAVLHTEEFGTAFFQAMVEVL